ncbi:hypothetical protein AAG570_002935, partial [Ranatra chinensis]
SNPGEVTQAVKDAIDAGYRHIDCAYIYGNEKEVGVAINDKIKDGTIQREDLFITSKLWNTFHREDLVIPILKETLSRLGIDYVDLYLIHWPMGYKEESELFPKDESGKVQYSDTHFTETWKSMEECVKLGLAKSIGVSNFNSKQIQEILDIAEIKPVNNQVECHPYLNQKKLIEFCKERGITVTAYSPLGSPGRTMVSADEVKLLDDPVIKSLADSYGKTVAQILIRYQVDRGVVVIPKSVNKTRIHTNFDIFDFSISPEDMKKIDSIDRRMRYVPLAGLDDHKDYPFKLEF